MEDLPLEQRTGPDQDEPVALAAVPVAPRTWSDDRSIGATAVLATFGAAAVAVDALRRALETAAHPGGKASDERAPVTLLPAALGASTAALLASGRIIARTVDAAARVGTFATGLAIGLGPPALQRVADELRRQTYAKDGSWREERTEAEALAGRVLAAIVPDVVDAVLDQLDLTALVLERVDLDAVVRNVDLEAAIARVDLDAIVAKVDLDEIVARLDVQGLAEGLDLNRIAAGIDVDRIAAGIDVDAVADRLDLDRVMKRLDLAAIATQVIDEIDLPEIIRGSTGAVANETIRDVRMQSIDADRAVERFVDRVIRRRARLTDVPVDARDDGEHPR